jgi:type I restriction-modification system DNA methylase subunit
MAKQKTVTEEPLEKQLWKTADKLRKNIDAAEYKHVVLGLIFLKYISDAFEELYVRLKAEESQGADPEDDFDFNERFAALKTELEAQLKEEERLNKVIAENLNKIKIP